MAQRRLTTLVLTLGSCLFPWAMAGEPAAIELARDKKALLPIVVAAEASAAVKATAAELARYLGQMSGAEFKCESGAGSAGLVLGHPADFTKLPFALQFGAGPFEREDYVLRSQPQGLYLLGATDLAVSHAAWDLLYRLGYRQFFPGPVWEVVPPPADLKIAVERRESPAFLARRIWYNWGLWGYNDKPYHEWCLRNRAVKGFDLNSGHSYEGIIAANKAEFDKHPEYCALVGGERKLRGDVKFCISNPDLRKLVAGHAVRFFKQNPMADSISMDPSDGGNWCECEACAKMGSVSDRVLMLANTVAEAINRGTGVPPVSHGQDAHATDGLGLGPGKRYVGMYAYNKHSAPPAIKAHPNVIVSATTAFIGGGLTFDQVVEGWKAQGATIGVYDYLSVVDWDWNLPRGGKGCRPQAVADSLVRFHDMGARFYDAESGDCWGPCGLGYYVASRVMWDLNEAQHVDALIADFLDKAFGPAKGPMREFYRLITQDTQRRSPSDMLGRMYRQLAAARGATSDPKVQERINGLLLFSRHAELYYAFQNGGGKVDDVARHDYRMRKTMMVHSYGLWSRLLSQKAALTPNHPLKSEEPFSLVELAKILADGIAKNQPVEPGFVSVEFSRKLVPAAARLKLPAAPLGSFPTVPQDHQQYYIWVPEGAGGLELKIRVQKVWANRMPKISLYSPLEVTLPPASGAGAAIATDESYKPDGKEYPITLNTPHPGLHRIESLDGGDYTRIAWPAGMPVTIESGIDTPDVTSHFRGAWTMYFYVPKGTKLVAGWASRVANWAPRVSGKLLDAEGREVLDFGKGEDGWFKVPVPEGQDGRLWKFVDSQGQRLLMTVPPYLARSAEELLLPAEVVQADAQQ